MIIVNGFQPLTIITKRSILDVAADLDTPLKPLIIITKSSFLDVWQSSQHAYGYPQHNENKIMLRGFAETILLLSFILHHLMVFVRRLEIVDNKNAKQDLVSETTFVGAIFIIDCSCIINISPSR